MQDEKKQHKVFAVGFTLISAVVLVFLLKPLVSDWKNREKNADEQKANAEILKAPSIVADDLFQKVQKKTKLFLVDISAPDDFRRGHIATAANVPADKLDKNFFKNIGADSASDIVIINQGGDLASLAAAVNEIVSSGFVNAKYLRGGIPDWREKGYPLVSSGTAETDSTKVKKITIDEIKSDAAANSGALQFLDVRNKDSFSKEHIVGAINIPSPELEERRSEIPALKKVIVYGANENDSFQAAVILFDLNFFNAYEMQGTIDDWKSAGGNVE